MKNFKPTQKLDIFRCYSQGRKQQVGTLAQNKDGVYFQYTAEYLKQGHNLSPFQLAFDERLQKVAPDTLNHMFGVFSDSLPDGWGTLLMDRVFRQQGIQPQQLTSMDRLAYIGQRGTGALSYQPDSEYQPQQANDWLDLANLGNQAQAVFDGQDQDVLSTLAYAASSGGARPKANIFIDPKNPNHISTTERLGFEAWLIKFTSSHLLLGHEEGMCEAAYLELAKLAGIDAPEWRLVTFQEHHQTWLMQKRFDFVQASGDKNSSRESGRYHVHSACGLLNADFRQPSLDYEELIKASQILCQSPAVAGQQFKRAMFNLFAVNQDDHSKNWSFLMDDQGKWALSPFYDVTYSPSPYEEHMTSYKGYGKAPPLKAIQYLAKQANFANWGDAQKIIQEVLDALKQWGKISNQLGVSAATQSMIQQHMNKIYKENQQLIKMT